MHNSVKLIYQYKNAINCLEPGEADKVEADTCTSTRACGCSQRWHISVKDGESGGGGEGDKCNLIQTEGTLGDSVGGQSDHKTLNKILDNASEELLEVNHS